MGFWIQSDEQFSYTLSFSPTSYICAKKTMLFFSNCGLGIKRVDEIISMFSSSLTLKLLFYPHILIACVNSYYVLDKLLTIVFFHDFCDFSAPCEFYVCVKPPRPLLLFLFLPSYSVTVIFSDDRCQAGAKWPTRLFQPFHFFETFTLFG